MSKWFLKNTKHSVWTSMLDLIKPRQKKLQLREVLLTICKSRNSWKALKGKAADHVFSSISQLTNSPDDVIERELVTRNSTSYTSQSHSMEKYIWGMVSNLVFKSGVSLSPEFCRALTKDCLCNPTDMKFAVFHSDIIATAAKIHAEILNSSLIELVIQTTEDSRAIYALKMAYLLPVWADVSDAALEALLSKCDPKRVEAMWLINERGKCSEVVDFIRRREFDPILSSVSEPMDIKWLTAAVMRFNGFSSGYYLGGDQLTGLSPN